MSTSGKKNCYCSASLNNAGLCPFGCTPKTRRPGARARATAKRIKANERNARLDGRVDMSDAERERARLAVAEVDPIYRHLRERSLKRHGKK